MRGIASCPPEILQSIFYFATESVVTEEVHGSARYNPPVNGRDILLESLNISDSPKTARLVPSIAVGGQSRWARVLRLRKTIVLVCRSWYLINIPDMYEHVYIHRIGQLPSLVRTLEESLSRESHPDLADQCAGLDISASRISDIYTSFCHEKRRAEALGLGRWVFRITIDCYVPEAWYDVFCDGLNRLFVLCPSIRLVIYGPLIKKSGFASRTSTALMDYLTLHDVFVPFEAAVTSVVPSLHLRNLRHLSLDPITSLPSNLCHSLSSIFAQLTSLEIGYFVMDEQADETVTRAIFQVKLHFPNLSTLALLSNTSINIPPARQLEIIAHFWELPELRRLFFNWSYRVEIESTSATGLIRAHQLHGLLDAHGSRLDYLFVDEDVSDYVDMDAFLGILRRCPNLRTLAIPYRDSGYLDEDLHHSALPHSALSRLILKQNETIVNSSRNAIVISDYCQIIEELATRGQFPALKTLRFPHLRICDSTLSSFPISSFRINDEPNIQPVLALEKCVKLRRLDRSSTRDLSCWVRILGEMGVIVENYQHRCLVALPEFGGLVEDLSGDDDSGDVGDDRHDGVSDSSDGMYEWDSEAAATTSYEDSDVDSVADSMYHNARNASSSQDCDVAVGEELVVVEQVGWEEALDIFHEIVQRDDSFSDAETGTSYDVSCFVHECLRTLIQLFSRSLRINLKKVD